MAAVIAFLVVLSVLVFVHELGHFATAKWFKMRVDEFAIGFPPKIFGIKRGETEYRINALPLGGYVRIFGENATTEFLEEEDKGRSFYMAAKWKQIVVLLAGVVMNWLTAFVLFTIVAMMGRPVLVEESQYQQFIQDRGLTVLEVAPDGPADQVLNAGDVITKLTNETGDVLIDPTESEMQDFLRNEAGNEIDFTIMRSGAFIDSTIVPKLKTEVFGPEETDIQYQPRGVVGISIGIVGTEKLPLLAAIRSGAYETVSITKQMFLGLADLIGGLFAGEGSMDDVAGPIGIAKQVGQAQAMGLSTLLFFAALLSVNLAVLNLLPIPALDGGRIVFVLVEMISGRNMPPAVLTWIHGIGFLLLMGLMLLVTVGDVIKLF